MNHPTLHNTDTVTHVFEAAGLGVAPFQFDCVTHSPGTTCDFCGTHIVNVFWVKSADQKRFKVGCDCIDKTHDAGLIAIADITRRKMEREKRHAREAAIRDIIVGIANDKTALESLAKLPHPLNWTIREFVKDANGVYVRDEKGEIVIIERRRTGLEYFSWMKRNSGNAGLAKLLKWCRANGLVK